MDLLSLLIYSNYIRSIRGKKQKPINIEDIECVILAKKAIEEKVPHNEINNWLLSQKN